MNQDLLKKFCSYICHYKLIGNDNYSIASYEIEPDGRKLKPLVKQLQKEGYLFYSNDGKDYFLTEKAWQELEARKPDLFSYWLKYMKDVRAEEAYVRFSVLDVEEQKWCFENSDYYLVRGEIFSNIATFYEGDSGKGTDFFVGSNELSVAVKECKREQLVERTYKYKFLEGLKHLGIMPKETPEFFNVAVSPFHGLTFSPDPSKWEKEVKARVAEIFTELAELQKVLKLLVEMQTGLYEYGWQKFLEDYRKVCEEAVDKKC